ncbi:hypothetical protein CURTO8I2_150082 [Curtobacterium sp. 8I-2]|nr:hypothetical protein CURTO8I2_150082 [Curtobacterium sp. 8I-2]
MPRPDPRGHQPAQRAVGQCLAGHVARCGVLPRARHPVRPRRARRRLGHGSHLGGEASHAHRQHHRRSDPDRHRSAHGHRNLVGRHVERRGGDPELCPRGLTRTSTPRRAQATEPTPLRTRSDRPTTSTAPAPPTAASTSRSSASSGTSGSSGGS